VLSLSFTLASDTGLVNGGAISGPGGFPRDANLHPAAAKQVPFATTISDAFGYGPRK
jgi:hypothetical protein